MLFRSTIYAVKYCLLCNAPFCIEKYVLCDHVYQLVNQELHYVLVPDSLTGRRDHPVHICLCKMEHYKANNILQHDSYSDRPLNMIIPFLNTVMFFV